MINQIRTTLKTYLAQYTTLYDLSSKAVLLSSNKNILSSPNLDGEVTFSGAKPGVSSIATLNNTFIFKNGKCETGTFFGDGVTNYSNIVMHSVNVGTAFNREAALLIVQNTDNNNLAIIYNISTIGQGPIKGSISSDMSQDTLNTIGVMFRTKAKQVDALDVGGLESLFINSITTAKTITSSLPTFSHIEDRFIVDDYYVLDLVFKYDDNVYLDDKFINSLKYFDAELGNVEIKIKDKK